MSDTLATLILAAGASTRMQEHIKQLLPWGNTTLLGHAITISKSISNINYVVLGAYEEEIRNVITEEAQFITNPNWKNGIGSSIAFGVSTITKNNPHVQAILILLTDQPLLDTNFFREMKHKFETGNNKIVATSYGKRVGVPAIFHKSLFQQLCDLHEDFGAKEIIKVNMDHVAVIHPQGKEKDIDTIEKYNHLTENK